MLLQKLASNLPEGDPLRSAFDAAALAGLTRRETQVLLALCSDERQDAIARSLGISPKTMSTHITAVYRKLSVHSSRGAMLWAIRNGAFDPAPRPTLNPFDDQA